MASTLYLICKQCLHIKTNDKRDKKLSKTPKGGENGVSKLGKVERVWDQLFCIPDIRTNELIKELAVATFYRQRD